MKTIASSSQMCGKWEKKQILETFRDPLSLPPQDYSHKHVPSCPDFYMGPKTSHPHAYRARILPLKHLNHFPSPILCFL